MKNKSYLSAFQQLKEKCVDNYALVGDNLLVEELPKEEYKSSGGIVIASSINSRQLDSIEDNRPMLVRVLLIGNGYYDDEGKEVNLDTKPGDIILIGKLGVKWLSSIAGVFIQKESTRVGLTRESEIQMRFIGQEGFDKFTSTLKENM